MITLPGALVAVAAMSRRREARGPQCYRREAGKEKPIPGPETGTVSASAAATARPPQP